MQRIQRSPNAIIFGAPEESNGAAPLDTVRTAFGKLPSGPGIVPDPIACVRLGMQRPGSGARPRPIKITFSSVGRQARSAPAWARISGPRASTLMSTSPRPSSVSAPSSSHAILLLKDPAAVSFLERLAPHVPLPGRSGPRRPGPHAAHHPPRYCRPWTFLFPGRCPIIRPSAHIGNFQPPQAPDMFPEYQWSYRWQTLTV